MSWHCDKALYAALWRISTAHTAIQKNLEEYIKK